MANTADSQPTSASKPGGKDDHQTDAAKTANQTEVGAVAKAIKKAAEQTGDRRCRQERKCHQRRQAGRQRCRQHRCGTDENRHDCCRPYYRRSCCCATGTVSNAVNNATIASKFTEFMQLLTTQLQNQDPLSPMDTNQFTQQLVEFAQVEQQMKSNDQLSILVSLQQSAQASQALALVGATVVVNGATVPLSNGRASKPATATVTIPIRQGRPSLPAATRSMPAGTASAITASSGRTAITR